MANEPSSRPLDLEQQAYRTMGILIGSIIVTLLLFYVIPFGRTIAYPLVLLSTLVHELGHGLAAVICGHDFIEFKMFTDGSGVAMTSGGKGAFAQAFVSAGGLVGPALVAAVFFAMGRDERRARFALGAFALMLIVAVIMVVRNRFGVIFVSGTAAVCLFIAAKGRPWISHVVLLFIACQLALAVFSRSDYLFTKYAMTSAGQMPSDVQKMADALFLPYWFWGAACAAISVGVLFMGLRASVRRA